MSISTQTISNDQVQKLAMVVTQQMTQHHHCHEMYINSHQTPQPGIPTACIMLITNWAKKVKKKAIKLKELSVLSKEKNHISNTESVNNNSNVENRDRWITWKYSHHANNPCQHNVQGVPVTAPKAQEVKRYIYYTHISNMFSNHCHTGAVITLNKMSWCGLQCLIKQEDK